MSRQPYKGNIQSPESLEGRKSSFKHYRQSDENLLDQPI